MLCFTLHDDDDDFNVYDDVDGNCDDDDGGDCDGDDMIIPLKMDK